jgi:hypothetical protein
MGEVVQLLPLNEQEWRGIAETLCGIDAAAGLAHAQRAHYLVRMREHFDVLGEPLLVKAAETYVIPGDLTVDQVESFQNAIRQAVEAHAARTRAIYGTRNARLLVRFAVLEAEAAAALSLG